MDGELKEILDEIDALKDSEVYKKIPEIARMDDVDNVDKMTIKRAKYNCRNPRRLIEETLLKKGLFKNYLSRDYVVYRNVELTNGLIIMLYVAYTNRQLSIDLVRKCDSIYDSVLINLDNFDNPDQRPFLSREFYEKIKKCFYNDRVDICYCSFRHIGISCSSKICCYTYRC